MTKHLATVDVARIRRGIIEARQEDLRLRPDGPSMTEQEVYDWVVRQLPYLVADLTFTRFRYHYRVLSDAARTRGIDIADLELPDEAATTDVLSATARYERARVQLLRLREEEALHLARLAALRERLQVAQNELTAAARAITDESAELLELVGK